MAEESQPSEQNNESPEFWGSTTRRNVVDSAKNYIKSVQSFLHDLQTLKDILEYLFEKKTFETPRSFTDPNGSTAISWLWNPPTDFNYSGFTSNITAICEAWRIAKLDNILVAEFDGESLQSLIRVFHELRFQPKSIDGSQEANAIAKAALNFITAVDRLELMLSLRAPKKETPREELPACLVAAEPNAADPVRQEVKTLKSGLQRPDGSQNAWHSDYFTVSELAEMRKAVKLPHSSTQMTREIKNEIANGRIQREGKRAMRLRMDLHKEWSTQLE